MFDVQINERGQITIPKEIRKKANIHPKDNFIVDVDDQGRLILIKKDIFSDLEELIKRDLVNQGYSEKDFATKIPERKRELAKALLKMATESQVEINNGEYSTLEEFKNELIQEDC
ncbi:MAG: AbrB/MazE/SpoVT family DNA-binding domain-containing protein [Candidatus Bathyarchaeota archaeon]|nr:AbrB/MazE/SpoVT family DNA-binding domain-containing protein [Candidatus Bathyarchaeota archaeon]